jgi:ATP-binding cassette, subfamily A (ABC1), member 3
MLIPLAVFALPWPSKTVDSLQFIFYFGLVMSAYPAFFALYPTTERLRGVRSLQYSNGVRSLPLWYVHFITIRSTDIFPIKSLILYLRLAYLVFDWIIVLIASAVVVIIFATCVPDSWYHLGDLFVCLFLYGIASILLSYVISLVARSQLSAFAFSAGGQAYVKSRLLWR